MTKRILKIAGLCLGGLLLLALLFILYLTVTAYNPDPVESLEITPGSQTAAADDTLRLLSFNIGYGGLGEESDFFMDGGEQVQPLSEGLVHKNLSGIADILLEMQADFYLLQEVDTGSRRSYGTDEAAQLRETLGYDSAYALNYHCDFVPFPMPPIGKVSSGLLTLSSTEILEAERVALPYPFKWPVSTANLKRCLLVSYIDLENTDAQLVLVNLHLEAYDDGSGKLAQTKLLLDLIESEYQKGNYVIAGGDFNQTFPGSLDIYPIVQDENWTPGVLNPDDLSEGWQYVCDNSAPTCRLLNQPYNPDDAGTQFYVIDGFILSPNVEPVTIETVDADFAFSDHNPVLLEVKLN